MLFFTPCKENQRFFMLFRVAEAQNIDLFGHEGDFFMSKNAVDFFVDFVGKVTKMRPK